MVVVTFFFRLTCSVVLWRGRKTANTGMCSQWFSHTGFAPAHSVCAFPVYTVQALGCSAGNCVMLALGCMHSPGLSCSGSGFWVLHKGSDFVGPVFCARPRSKQLRWPGAWQALLPPGGGCDLPPPPSLPLGFLGVQLMHLLRCALCLFWGADLWLRPSQRMSTIQNPKKSWLAMNSACSLVDDASLGLRLPPSGSGCHLPVSGGGWAGPQQASSAQSFVLWVGLVVS